MQKLKKSIDFLKKKYAAKIAERSARFRRLADTHNICVVYQNKPNLKSCLLEQRFANKEYIVQA